MTPDEVRDFLAGHRVITCATIGRDGWPHMMPLWYVLRDGTPWAWTYAKSQKVRNLERDPRCTLQAEAGYDDYGQLRGVMVKAEAVLHHDLDAVIGVGAAIAARYSGVEVAGQALELVRAQAAKRVALEFRVIRTATWDHRKLAGTY